MDLLTQIHNTARGRL